MKIAVTRGHIARGTRRECSLCPIALAVREALGAKAVSVDDMDITVETAGGVYRCNTPKSAEEFIYHYDDGESVEPFEFELALIPWGT